MAEIERVKRWLQYNEECPDRHISEYRDVFLSLFDVRDLVAENERLRAALTTCFYSIYDALNPPREPK